MCTRSLAGWEVSGSYIQSHVLMQTVPGSQRIQLTLYTSWTCGLNEWQSRWVCLHVKSLTEHNTVDWPVSNSWSEAILQGKSPWRMATWWHGSPALGRVWGASECAVLIAQQKPSEVESWKEGKRTTTARLCFSSGVGVEQRPFFLS